MLFPKVNGELHIKYGAIESDDDFVVKLATGFFENPKLGLNPFSGCMLVFSQKTGHLSSVLLEEGELTNHRTAAAGAVAAKYLAPKEIDISITGGEGVGKVLQGIYEVEESLQPVCFRGGGGSRPDSFESFYGDESVVVTFVRE